MDCAIEFPVTKARGSQTSIKAAEGAGQHQRHDQHARRKREHVPSLAEFEAPNPAHEQISDGKIEEAPQHVHRRGRQPYTGRSGKGTLEWMT